MSAIKVLEAYKFELIIVNDTKSGNNWIAKVINSLTQYIGKDSALYGRFIDETFTDKITKTGLADQGWVGNEVTF